MSLTSSMSILSEHCRMVAGDLDRLGAVTDDLEVRGELVVVVLLLLLVDGGGIALAEGVARLAADGLDVDVLPLSATRVDEACAALTMFELKAPAKPLSPATTTTRTFFSSRSTSSGCRTSPVSSSYGRCGGRAIRARWRSSARRAGPAWRAPARGAAWPPRPSSWPW